MKRILLISGVLATMLLSACATPAVTEQPTPATTPVVEPAKPTPVQPTQPKPATFTISDLSISPAEINRGGQITISVLTTNNGDLAGNYKVIFKISNVTVETVDVPLASGDIKKVDFAATVNYAAGTYSVNVNGLLGTFIVKAAPTPTLTPTVITSAAELVSFLSTSFSSLETSLGVTKFTFEVEYNETISYPYDYKIMVDYDGSFVYDLGYSNKISTELANKVADEMRAHQEKLARAVIALMPNTKLIGGYYTYGYMYPTIKVDRYTITYCSWANFAPATYFTKYADAKITDFVWTPDSLLWPGQKDGQLGR